mgnify:CR=1 FL=1|jgi:CNT family concentrative nucleoside transporter
MFRSLSVALFFFLTCQLTSGQSIEGKWTFQSIVDDAQKKQIAVSPSDSLILKSGEFFFRLKTKGIEAQGQYLQQNQLLVFYYDFPVDSVSTFRILKKNRNELVLHSKRETYRLTTPDDATLATIPVATKDDTELIPSSGFSVNSLFRGALGMIVLLLLAYVLSNNRKAINWRTVFFGLMAQLVLAVGVLKVPAIQYVFETVGKGFVKILDFTMAGTKFLFASFSTNEIADALLTFAISILPTIIFFSALTSVLFYLGVIQKIVRAMAWLLTTLLQISGAESLSVAGNIFLGQTESPLMIKAYLEKMTKSEILLVMIGGMATVAGGVLAAYIGFLGGEDEAMRIFYAKHLLTASVMAAPGAVVISKMLYPQQEPIDSNVEVSKEVIGSNILDAIANGTTEGLKLAVNVGAMLLVFLAFIAMINGIFGWIGGVTGLNPIIAAHTNYQQLSIELLLGYMFAPLMWLIGVAKEDVTLMGQLIGIKLAASEFVGYIQLAELKDMGSVLHLKYEKSIIMATYMLCGFANFASIGIQIGGIGSLAPGQRKTLSKFGMRALIGGTLASLLSATIAGMIIG